MKKIILSLSIITCIGATAQSQDIKLNANNINEVVAAMTLREKAEMLVGGGNTEQYNSTGLGAKTTFVAGAAGITRPNQRLGVPPTLLTDGPAGVHIDATRKGEQRNFFATSFPVATALACSWNTQLIDQVGQAIGEEVQDYGCDVLLAPGMNLHRNPLCGRNFEYFSEDPVLSGKMAASFIVGVQKCDVGACPKHFAVNSQETQRRRVDERVSQRALRELYLRNFEIAVREGKPWTIMSSYNKINGTLAQQSEELLTQVLRNDWGFDGMVMTDWIGLRDTRAQVSAGNDLMEPGKQKQIDDIINQVNNGSLSIEAVNTCVKRVLEMVVRSPHFKGLDYNEQPDLDRHAAIARQSAHEGIVMLKNDDNALPLNHIKTAALFGVNSYDFLACGFGSGFVNAPHVIDLVQGLKENGIGTTSELTDIYNAYVPFALKKFRADKDTLMWFFDQGQPKLPEIELSDRCIENAVKQADIAILTIGRMAGEDIDRMINDDFNITSTERDLINRVSTTAHACGKKLIVVINSGSVIETASWKHLADAIIVAWQAGQEGGFAVADILTGKVNPSGKLSMSWPVSIFDDPSTRNFPNKDLPLWDYLEFERWGAPINKYDYANHDEDIYVGYRYYDTFNKQVSYPFGFGMSYTTFEFDKPQVKLNGSIVEVKVSVKNTGKVPGKEVAEVYVSAPQQRLQKPNKELKAFAKTKLLQPGETQQLVMTLNVRDLASFDEANSEWLAEKGQYIFNIGNCIDNCNLRATLTLTNEYHEAVSNVLAPKHKLNLLKHE